MTNRLFCYVRGEYTFTASRSSSISVFVQINVTSLAFSLSIVTILYLCV